MANIFKKFNKKKRVIKQKIKQKISDFIIDMCAKSKRLSLYYYCFFSDALQPSGYKTLNAIKEFRCKSPKSWSNISVLVRNIHRLEKALCIQNSSRVFGLDFIQDTLKALENEIKFDKNRDLNLLIWANDVLDEYFLKFKNEEAVKIYFKEFVRISLSFEGLKNSQGIFKPFHAKNLIKSDISLEDFAILAKQKKSIRFYDESREVEEEKLLRAVEIATNTPSACNKFPLTFYLVTNKEKLKIASKIPYGITCFSDHIPAMCFLVVDLSAYHQESGMLGTPYVDAGLAATNFMYALELQGLSSCPINWTQTIEKEKEIKKFLNLENYETCTICFTIGYAENDVKVCYSQRKSIKNAATII